MNQPAGYDIKIIHTFEVGTLDLQYKICRHALQGLP